jgi:hypothetical protein
MLVSDGGVAADSRRELIEMARLAEVADRHDDMASVMRQWAQLDDDAWHHQPVSAEEWNLFSVAYKSKVCTRRSSWRAVCEAELKTPKDSNNAAIVRAYRQKIEEEIRQICQECLVSIYVQSC